MSTQEKSDKTNEVQLPGAPGALTAREYQDTEPDSFMELINGTLYIPTRGASFYHQTALGNLSVILHRHFKGRFEVYFAPLDVYMIRPGEDWMETRNVFQPDLLVVCDSSKLHDIGCIGVPDLLVEVLMAETASRDLGPKRDLYEEYGVKELWIVHPAVGTIALHVLENGKYRILPLLAKGQILKSPTFPDLQFNLDEAFPEDIEIG